MRFNRTTRYVKQLLIYIIVMLFLFSSIAVMTIISSSEHFPISKLPNWTERVESSTFLYLMGMESKVYREAFPAEMKLPKISSVAFQIATSIKPSDPRSLLGNEIPGFSLFNSQVLMAGEDGSHTSETIESPPPLEEILKDREAVVDQEDDEDKNNNKQKLEHSTEDRNVVFIYNSHNRESFLPHLPDIDDPNQAFHEEVNITKVSDHLADSLKAEGIGTVVDKTDHMKILNEKGWGYGRSYEASRAVVREAFANNKDYKYVFDLHRDTPSRDVTTTDINGEAYAKVMIVIGADHSKYKSNLKLANEIKDLLEEKYPGIMRKEGVNTKQGASTNGVFNQDLSEKSLLFEIGGVENDLKELYRTADALSDIFSEFYWDAEKVSGNEGD